jgi:hypothetical protein
MKKLVLIASLIVTKFIISQNTVSYFKMTPELHAEFKKKKPVQFSTVIDGKVYEMDMDKYAKISDSLRKIPIDTIKARFIKYLNIYRVSLNLTPVTEYLPATEATKFIVDYNCKLPGIELSHTTNIPGYQTFTNRCDKIIKISRNNAGENLLKIGTLYSCITEMLYHNISFEQVILKYWINSKGHNRNLTIKNANYVGFNVSANLTVSSSILIDSSNGSH